MPDDRATMAVVRSFAVLVLFGCTSCEWVFKLNDPTTDATADAQTFGGLVARYSMDDVTNGMVLDSEMHQLHATCVACPTPVPGAVGGGLGFNGTNQILDIPMHPELETTEGFTVAAWVFQVGPVPDGVDEPDFACMVDKQFQQQSSWLMTLRDDNSLVFVTAREDQPADPDRIFGFTFSDVPVDLVDRWHHIAIRWDGEDGVKDVFLDGAKVGGELETPVLFDGGAITIGGQRDSAGDAKCFWPGGIDEVQIYDHALNNTEISVLFAAGTP